MVHGLKVGVVQSLRTSASICHIMAYLLQSPRIFASICHIMVYLGQSPRICASICHIMICASISVSYTHLTLPTNREV